MSWWIDWRLFIVTLDLVLKLMALAPTLEKDGATIIAELKSDDDNKAKVLALIGDVEKLLDEVKSLLS